MLTGLFIYSINGPATHFPCLLFQTRYGTNCFPRRAREGGEQELFLMSYTPVAFLLTNHKARCMPPKSHTLASIDQRDAHHEVLSAGSKYSQITFQPD